MIKVTTLIKYQIREDYYNRNIRVLIPFLLLALMHHLDLWIDKRTSQVCRKASVNRSVCAQLLIIRVIHREGSASIDEGYIAVNVSC